ncbi:MAG TPA: hypothetical protein VGV18_06940 [Verrucomicrobiae bacterium]|nr:hypothetical protein [Verrucomicrobiae bacterium]
METDRKKSDESETRPQLDEHAICEVCSRPGAFHFGDRTICQDCYTGCGSCCPEFGKHDLWTFPETDALY